MKDQREPIIHIHYNKDLNLWLSISLDGYVNLYTLPLCKLVRTIKSFKEKCIYGLLSSSPLPSIVTINKENNKYHIAVYSINGRLIANNYAKSIINSPIIIKDLNANEYLCIYDRTKIQILNLPNLENISSVDISSIGGLYNIFVSIDTMSLYCLNKSGSKVYVIRDKV